MPEFSCSGPITVDLRLGGGTCELRAESSDTARVDVEPYDNSDAAQAAAREARVEVTGDTLVISAPEASGWLFRRSPRLRVTAMVPTGSSGRLRVATADITCHGEWSDVKVNTASGDTYLERVTGDVTVNSASADVRTGQVDGRLTVNTASGNVSATSVRGAVEVKGASGDLEIDNLGEGLRSNSASGDVRIGAASSGSITVNSASGDVSVGVVTGTGVWLDLNTLSGRTESDLAIGGDTPVDRHDLAIQVRTMSGNIDIRRVTAPEPA